MSTRAFTTCDRCERIIDDTETEARTLILLGGVKPGVTLDQFDVDANKDADLCGKCAARVYKLIGPKS